MTTLDRDDEAPIHTAVVKRWRPGVGLDDLRLIASSPKWKKAFACDRGKSKQSVLHIAATGSSLELVRFLVEQGQKPTARDARTRTPVHMAITSGNSEAFHYFLDVVGERLLAMRGERGRTLLHQAARHARWDVVDFLLRRGANPTVRDHTGKTAAQSARARAAEDFLEVEKNFGRDVQRYEQDARSRLKMADYLEGIEKEWRAGQRFPSAPTQATEGLVFGRARAVQG